MEIAYSTQGPICPHCRHLHQADEPFYYDESVTELECMSCEQKFVVSIITTTSWSTGADL